MENENAGRHTAPQEPLSEVDRRIIAALQGSIPLTEEPYRDIARDLGMGEEELLARLKSFIADGRLRRLGATLYHREAGVSANAMGVWRVSEERREQVGRIMASFDEVTHCYERPEFPGWPYQLYTMIHARTPEECRAVADRLAQATGFTEYELLFSTREFKKTSMQYF